MHSRQSHSEGDGVPGKSRTLVKRVQGILATKGLTLYQVAALTRVRYMREPAYHIPRNLYFQLRSTGLSPTIQQLFTLSQLSGYRLADWLAVFGFSLDEIPRLQAALYHPRTMLFDTRVYDPGAAVPRFRDRARTGALPPVAPLSQLLEVSGVQRLSSLLERNRGDYLYAKIGRQDAFAYPDLLPGSIVRANPRLVEQFLPKPGETSAPFFLVEHSRGFSCCRLHLAAKNRVTLIATQLPFANVELQLPSEARILGVLDLELRPLTNHRRPATLSCVLPEVARDLARLWTPARLEDGGIRQPVSLLRKARLRSGLSFRAASEMSRTVAKALGDERYFASPGALSNLEASDTPARHIHKLLTVCILYFLDFAELLNFFGVALEESGMSSIPDEWMARSDWQAAETQLSSTKEKVPSAGFLATALERLGRPPLFLRNSLSSLSALPEVTLRDVFWVGGQERPMHPSLAGALFVIVNHRRKKPRAFRRKSLWEQPLYLLRKRDGSYLLASCSVEDGAIVVHPYTEGFVRPERFRNRVDAEMVGQIVTVVRSLPAPT